MPRWHLVMEFAVRLDRCRTMEEVNALLDDLARELGFDCVAMLHSPSLARRSSWLIRYDTYPPGWDRRLVGRGQLIIDPILSIAQRTTIGFIWPDVPMGIHFTSAERAILAEGVRHGLRQGITIPANVPGEPPGSITFATRRTRTISRERLLIAEAIGRLVFDAARRINGLSAQPFRLPNLNPRERECVYWMARGKIDRDIAEILGISLETVRSNVKAAFKKLNVITRGQLVHEALRLGIIDFDPSIPPYG